MTPISVPNRNCCLQGIRLSAGLGVNVRSNRRWYHDGKANLHHIRIRNRIVHARWLWILVLCAVVTSGCQDSNQPVQESNDGKEETAAVEDGLTLTAHWAPFKDSEYQFGERWETVGNLKPEVPSKTYSARELSVLLPPKDVHFGEYWTPDVVTVIPFLKQLHSGATHRLHHGGPQGAIACIDAENETYQRVRVRAHAEFDLPDGKYTPSQFAGELLIERATQKVLAFRLAVPPRRNNVDLNWERKTPEGEVYSDADGNIIPMPSTQTIADIGYCERLELTGGDWAMHDALKWDRQLAFEQVQQRFRTNFYKFAKIRWLDWETAVAESIQTGRPLHVVALFGILDDESC